MMLAFFAAITTVNAQDFPKVDKSPTDIAHYPTNAAKRAVRGFDPIPVAAITSARGPFDIPTSSTSNKPSREYLEVWNKYLPTILNHVYFSS